MEGLMSRARRGDGDAWRELVRVHEPALFGYALRRVGRHADAEDVVQGVFVALLMGKPVSDRDLGGRLREMTEQRLLALA